MFKFMLADSLSSPVFKFMLADSLSSPVFKFMLADSLSFPRKRESTPLSPQRARRRSKLEIRKSKMGFLCLLLSAFCLLLFCSAPARAQVATGTPPFGSFSGGPDVVNNANLNVHLAIPVVNKAGRGMPFNYNLTYDTSVWYPVGSGSSKVWQPVSNWGWSGWTQGGTGYISFNQFSYYCTVGYGGQQVPYETVLSDFIYYDAWGGAHYFPGQNVYWAWSNNPPPGCGSGTNSYDTNAKATDDSGYVWNGQNWNLTDPSGKTFTPPYEAPSGAGSVTDANGDSISVSNGGVFTDTLGTTALTVTGSGTPSSPYTFQYTGAGGSATVTVKYTAYTVRTNFGCSGKTEFGPTSENLVSEIDLPDDNPSGTRDRYLFTYESTVGYSGDVTGRLVSVKLPSGGTITYQYYTGSTPANDITCADGSASVLERFTPDTGSSSYWLYQHSESGTAWTTTLTDPQNNVTTFNFQSVTPTGSTTAQAYETERQLAGSLGTIYTCYNGASEPCNNTSISLPITQRTVWTTLGSLTSEVNTQYDSSGYGLPGEVDEYDWGLTLVRQTFAFYDYNNSCGVTNSTVIDRPCLVEVKDGSSNLVASTSFTYDANGNLLNKSSGGLTLNFNYNSNGTLNWSKDAGGNQTSYGYGSNSCSAFPDTVTPPISALATTSVWNCYGAVPSSVTDANSKTTNLTYDLMNRLTAAGYPDGGSVTVTYAPTQVQTTTKITSSVSRTDTASLDSQGRLSSKTVAGVTTNTTYDALGRVSTVGVSGSGAQDTYQYDALSRVKQVTHADNSSISTDWTNPQCPKATDESGKVREVCTDGLGRTNQVIEDPSGLDYTTTYSHDPLNDLIGVTQGSQSRSFQYDGLGRLTQATTPESGTVYYTYDSDSTCGTSSGDLVKRVDARGIRTCYGYDALHRLTSKSYNDGVTPTANFYYDETSVTLGSWTSGTLANPKGRLTHTTAMSGSTVLAATVSGYDAMGRTANFWQCTPSNCGSSSIWTSGYNYDLAGDVSSWNHPHGYTITNSINAAQQITAVSSTWSDSGHPAALVSNVSYTPFGAINTLTDGCVGSGCTHIQETYTYNNRLQPTMIQLGTASNNSADFCLVYNYYGGGNPTSCTAPTQGSNNNGNVMGYFYQESVNPWGHAATYTYDGVNRLASGLATGSIAYSLGFGYDQWGNMTCTGGAGGGSANGYCPQWTYNTATNRFSASLGFSYDAAGNLLGDGTYSYTWDAEGRNVSASQSGTTVSTNTYNALGQAAETYYPQYSDHIQYLYDPAGKALGTYHSPSNQWWYDHIFLGDRKIATLYGSPSETAFVHPNSLGSTGLTTNHAGNALGEELYYPWGQFWQLTNNWSYDAQLAGFQEYKGFLWTTPNRSYYPNYGRWLSPDPLGGHITNPQSFNRYAYVLNNPTSMVDPLGLLPYAGSTPSCGSIPSGIELGGAALAGYAQCQNWWKMWASSGQSEGCMAGEYGCGSQNPTYGEDIFDALAGDSQTKVWVDANGNIGFTVNLNLTGGIPGWDTGTGNPNQFLTEWGTVGSTSSSGAAQGVFTASSNSGFSPGYPGNPNFQPGGFVCVTCGPWTDGGTSPAPKPKAPSPSPKPPTMGAPGPFSLPGVPLAGWSTVLFPVPSSR